MNIMLLPLRRYADFSGRSRRKEFWLFYLFILIGSLALSVVDSALGLGGGAIMRGQDGGHTMSVGYSYGGGVLSGLFGLAMLMPAIAVSVRRLHDSDRSGWWFLIGLIPLLGGLFLLYHYVQPGTHGPNRFGADPLADPIDHNADDSTSSRGDV